MRWPPTCGPNTRIPFVTLPPCKGYPCVLTYLRPRRAVAFLAGALVAGRLAAAFFAGALVAALRTDALTAVFFTALVTFLAE